MISAGMSNGKGYPAKKLNVEKSMVISFFTSCPITGGLPARLCEGKVKKDISMLKV